MNETGAWGRQRLPLAGQWRFAIDPGDAGVGEAWYARELEDRVTLPGTMDENGKGERHDRMETDRLSRKFRYRGPAWYQRDVEIPASWAGKRIVFAIERTKSGTVWIDEEPAGHQRSLCAPHVYEASRALTPGRHRITVRIDNGDHPAIGDPHQISDHTQTNWNGLLGDISLQATDRVWIEEVQIYPEMEENRLRVRGRIGNRGAGAAACRVSLQFADAEGMRTDAIAPVSVHVDAGSGESGFEAVCELSPSAAKWDEFEPNVYTVTATLETQTAEGAFRDVLDTSFGIRQFAVRGTQFAVNGHTTFLRGKNDSCVFPLTGYAPMETEEWLRLFEIAKAYGINHYRFHTWCPPEAAFAAADRAGIYLQPELPFWYPLLEPDEQRYDPDIKPFLQEEGERILRQYGNHPSFVMFALGNELLGSRGELMDLVRHFQSVDPRRLYAEGSNNFYNTPDCAEGQDFWVTMRTGAGVYPVRGAFASPNPPLGHIQTDEPSTVTNYARSIRHAPVPVIGHEIGQYQVYPNYGEIGKYTGVLEPRNLLTFRQRLADAGMLDQAEDFFRASGALSALCYREEIEAALRTPGFGGFQLLDLQDFPGQGTALVGMLDAFMDSKGLIEPEAWRQFCSPTVLLLQLDQYVWHSGEMLTAEVQVANYGPGSWPDAIPVWTLRDEHGAALASGELPAQTIPQGKLASLGSFSVDMSRFAAPAKRTLEIRLKGTEIVNRYPIWIYPNRPERWSVPGAHVRGKLDEATTALLERGERVLLLPARRDVKLGVQGAFAPDFWNYGMFRGIAEAEGTPVAPGTLGMLCDPRHPALAEFPTDSHGDWQWWRLLTFSRPVILDDMPSDYRPIVQMIDNVDRNHKLGVLFEAKVGAGRLLVCTMDLLELRHKPEAKQLMASLLRYVASDRFDPQTDMSQAQLKRLLG